MKQYTLGTYTINDFADYLNGTKNDHFSGIEGAELIIEGEHILTKTLNLHFPITITGNNAVIKGENSDIFAFSVVSSDVTVQNLFIDNFKFGLEVDGLGSCVENVLVQNVTVKHALNAIEVGSSRSNSILRNITFNGCTVISKDAQWQEYEYADVSLGYVLCCARHKGGDTIDNCLLDGLYVNNCTKEGSTRAGITFLTAIPSGGTIVAQNLSYSNLVVRNINITNNHVQTCWDVPITVVAQCINTGVVTIDGVNITGNYCEQGISGMQLCGGAHHFEEGGGSSIKNIKITNNHIKQVIEDLGEPARGIFMMGVRGDYYPGMKSCDYLIENVEIANNKFEGVGVVITGVYTFLDGPVEHKNNAVRNVNIHHNEFIDVDCPFVFDGCQMDGRLFDWNFGYPRHDKKWGEEIGDHSVVTAVMTNNRVENITCTDNTIEGYRYKVKASGATGHGHGACKNNKVCGDIVFERNSFGTGENHIHVQGFVCDDYVRDLGGNDASNAFL